MAKRLQLNFHKPTATRVSEDGQARPCAQGVGWVNVDTLQTLAVRDIQRTDAKGQPLAVQSASESASEPAADSAD